MLHGGIGKTRSAKIAVSLDPRCWGNGTGTKAVHVHYVIDYAFEEFGFHRIGPDTNESNARFRVIREGMRGH
jgi:RimJ/RimL family protein N-acetyltransferase